MKKEEQLKIFKQKGWCYNPETGEIFSHTGKSVGIKTKEGYLTVKLRHSDGSDIVVKSHRLAWYLHNNIVPDIIDHINRVRNDNRIVNLRNVDYQVNSFNTDAKGYSIFRQKGKKDKLRVRIMVNGKNILIGYFPIDKEKEAHQAYLVAKKIYHVII